MEGSGKGIRVIVVQPSTWTTARHRQGVAEGELELIFMIDDGDRDGPPSAIKDVHCSIRLHK